MALWQSIPSMPVAASAAIFPTVAVTCGVAKEEAAGTNAKAMEIEIARMVRMMPKDGNTSNLNALSIKRRM